MIEEADLEEVGSGLAPVTDGWFAVNLRDEGDEPPFAQLGINMRVLSPRRSTYLYHDPEVATPRAVGRSALGLAPSLRP